MADLQTTFLGIKLKNPVLISSGPLTRSGDSMKKALSYGVGGVVTETIASEIRKSVRPRLIKRGAGMQNIRLYSEYSIEEWTDEIALVKKSGGVCIANITGQTSSEMAYIATLMEKSGADALELNAASPHGEGLEVFSADPNRVFDMVKKVADSVDIPVMVKLSPNVSNLAKLAKAAEKGGAAGISAINTVRSILGVDIETEKPLLPTFGGYSGGPIRPIGLAAVATIAQAVPLPVSGVGGISSWKHVLEYMMLGASTIQLHTAVMLMGYKIIPEILESLSRWLDMKGYTNITQIQGNALPHLKSFEEIHPAPYIANLSSSCPLPDCDLCINSCIYDAAERDRYHKIKVKTKLCTGCGLCVSVCPKNCFEMVWG